MSYDAVPDGNLAAVVTFLEMHAPPAAGEVPLSPLSLRRIERPSLDEYRRLFRLVGEPWLWFSRLILNDDQLTAIVHDPAVEIFAVVDESGDVGLLELDFRKPGEAELGFVGLIPELSGKGHGRWLLAEAIRLAWREGVVRVHVHTCSLDHPAALTAYRRAGFTPYKRAIERFLDPRALGILPADCAPQIPLLAPVRPAS